MDNGEWPEVPTNAGDVYETLLVPAIFEEWAPRILDAAGVGIGDRVLDVACGTGVVSRQAARRVGAEGEVVGLDLTEAMIEVAAGIEPSVDWRVGDAMDLPFEMNSFDVVVCQAGLMFFPDRVRAVGEMHRVLREGGRLALLVWGESAGQSTFADLVERQAGREVADRYRAPWSMRDPEDLRRVVESAGFNDVEVRVETGTARFASLEAFLASTSILLAGHVDEPQLAAAAAEVMAPFGGANGGISIPGLGNIATASKITA